MFEAKRCFRDSGKDKVKDNKEITDVKIPVFAGQIFAEMFAAISPRILHIFGPRGNISLTIPLTIGIRDFRDACFLSIISLFI